MTPRRQLRVYRFRSGAEFEGRLLGALERLEAGGALRVLDTLFVGRDTVTGEISAIDLTRKGAGALVVPLVRFRLEPAERRRVTERALDDDRASAGLIRALATQLEPGEAVAAILVAHLWAEALDDAVARLGGTAGPAGFVEPETLADLMPELLAAAGAGG
jgi:hypothetical protein